MPELPEVETIRRDLAKHLLEKSFVNVEIKNQKSVRGATAVFKRNLRGAKVVAINRRGKLLLIELASGRTLIIHLKMTGQLFYRSGKKILAGGHGQDIPQDLPGKHTHVIFSFTDDAVLYFNDMRKFGYISLADVKMMKKIMLAYGPEPLTSSFTADYLQEQLRKRSTSLKAVLLNQSVVAGLGNIYVDEAAFLAGVRPTRRANRLTRPEAIKLHTVIKNVLRQAIKLRGTTFRNYRDAHGRGGRFFSKLNVYGRDGQMCFKCHKSKIKKIVVAGRGTHFCPSCQKR